MALFSRKSDEEKIQKKQLKEARDRKRKAIAAMVRGSERLSHAYPLNIVSDEVRLDEEALFVATGTLDSEDANAALVATNERIIIGWMKGVSFGHLEIRYSDIDQIDVGMKLSGSWVALHHGSHKRTLEKSVTKDLENLKQVVRDQQQKLAATPPAPAPESSSLDDLSKLADLHKQGILTDDEFAAAKAKALGL